MPSNFSEKNYLAQEAFLGFTVSKQFTTAISFDTIAHN